MTLIKENKKYKDRSISIRLTACEYEEIRLKAKLYSKTISSFLRHVISNYEVDIKTGEGKRVKPSPEKLLKDKPQENL